MFKRENGITLVALVVTIIVLLILAGVSISMVAGENGIATKAKSAASLTALKSAQEAVNLAMSAVETEYYSGFADSSSLGELEYTAAKINEQLNGYSLLATGDVTLNTVFTQGKITLDLKESDEQTASYSVEFTVSEKGNVTSAVVEAK